jgi:hypothetical protein
MMKQKNLLPQILCSLWMILMVFVWYVLSGDANSGCCYVQYERQLPAAFQKVIEGSRSFLFPYVYRAAEMQIVKKKQRTKR